MTREELIIKIAVVLLDRKNVSGALDDAAAIVDRVSLIHAAPKMLKALESIVSDFSEDDDPQFRAARALIAEAKGE